MQPGDRVFVQVFDESDERILHEGELLEVEKERWTMGYPLVEPPVSPGLAVGLYFAQQNIFVTCPARIASAERDEEHVLKLEVILEGEPVSADNRESYRVCAIGYDLPCSVGEYSETTFADISSGGFAVITTQELRPGTTHEITFTHEGESYEGQARLLNAKALPSGKYRYGFRLLGVKTPLEEGLQELSLWLQREQLARLSGIA